MSTSVRLQVIEVLRHHSNLTLHELAATLCVNSRRLSSQLSTMKHAGEIHITNPGQHVSGSKTLKARYSIGAPPPKLKVPGNGRKPAADWPFPRVSSVWDLGYLAAFPPAPPRAYDQEGE